MEYHLIIADNVCVHFIKTQNRLCLPKEMISMCIALLTIKLGTQSTLLKTTKLKTMVEL